MGLTGNLPDLAGTVDRRLLINYSVDPDVIARMLPLPFRPQLVRGRAVAGICLIRLQHMRPAGLPTAVRIGDPDEPEPGGERPSREGDSVLSTRDGRRVFRTHAR